MNEAEHISRLRAFAHWFAMNGGHMTEECKDALTLLADYDALKARLAEAEGRISAVVDMCAGEAEPRWPNDMRVTGMRGRILDVCQWPSRDAARAGGAGEK